MTAAAYATIKGTNKEYEAVKKKIRDNMLSHCGRTIMDAMEDSEATKMERKLYRRQPGGCSKFVSE